MIRCRSTHNNRRDEKDSAVGLDPAAEHYTEAQVAPFRRFMSNNSVSIKIDINRSTFRFIYFSYHILF
jgi:hypothetical protein